MGLVDGTMNVTSTPAAVNGSSATPFWSAILQADSGNTLDILVGSSASQSVRLAPGAAEEFAGQGVGDLIKLYVKTTASTATLNFHALTST